MISKENFAKAQAAAVSRNDIVVEVARIIAPTAFSGSDRKDRAGAPADVLRFSQAKALEIARAVLEKVASLDSQELRRQLAEAEIANWLALGVPAGAEATLRDRVERKYGLTKSKKDSDR